MTSDSELRKTNELALNSPIVARKSLITQILLATVVALRLDQAAPIR
jgi:hypothetical protein